MIEIQYKATEDLIPYARNSRTHSAEQVAQIAASIREFGWTNPILIDGENGIIAGHGRVLAAHKLGKTQVPTIELSHMSDTQKRAYIIADNKLALNAGWDNEMLALEIDDLKEAGFDLSFTGFTIDDINALKTPDFDAATEDDQGKLDQLEPKWIACPHCGKEFDARQA
jgi:ParB-like chromosome segregation protein Spo0J